MPYISDITEPLIKALDHFAGLPKHQLAGHAGNFDFWKAEVEHALQVLEGYETRFRRLKEAQTAYVKVHGAGIVHEAGDFDDVYEKKASSPPLQKNLRAPEVRELKTRLETAFECFVARLHNEQLFARENAESKD